MNAENSPPNDGLFAGLTIGVDALNASLAQGTGIATYARGLSETALAGGGRVQFVFDRPLPPKGAALSVAAFDAQIDARRARLSASLAGRIMHRIAVAIRAAGSAGAIKGVAVNDNGAVLRKAYAERIPEQAGLVFADGLGEFSNLTFRSARRFANLKMKPCPDIFHWTTPIAASCPGAINLYTIHDLVPLRLPDATLDVKASYEALVRSLARRKEHILTVSEHSRRDIVNHLGADPDHVHTAPPVVEADPVVAAESEEEIKAYLAKAYNVRWKKYFLFFGSIEPKKNLGRIIEAYAGANVDYDMIIVSALSWLADNDLRLLAPYIDDAEETPLSKTTRRLEYLPRRDLHRLIRGARAAVLASTYEGFGLPVAEAAAYGVPSLAAKGHALEETGLNGAVYADPFNIAEIRNSLIALASNDALCRTLGANAEKAAARFRKERQIEAFSKIYESIGAIK